MSILIIVTKDMEAMSGLAKIGWTFNGQWRLEDNREEPWRFSSKQFLNKENAKLWVLPVRKFVS